MNASFTKLTQFNIYIILRNNARCSYEAMKWHVKKLSGRYTLVIAALTDSVNVAIYLHCFEFYSVTEYLNYSNCTVILHLCISAINDISTIHNVTVISSIQSRWQPGFLTHTGAKLHFTISELRPV